MIYNFCPNCGTLLDRPSALCPACGAPEITASSTEIQGLLSEAYALLRESRFDEAKTAFEAIIQKDCKNAFAYWGRLRARYHITYTEAFDGKCYPQCPTPSGETISEDTDYRKATELADEKMQAFLQTQADYIEALCADNGPTKNITHQFTMGEVDPNDEFIPYPNRKRPPLQGKSKKSLSAAFVLLDESRFDEAKTAFEAILTKEPQSTAAYFGRLCARYHITYTEVFDDVFAPHCPTPSGANLTADTDYRRAMEYADEEWQAFLREQAEYIARIYARTKDKASEFPMGTVDPEDEFVRPSKKERRRKAWKRNKKKILLSTAFTLLFAVILCWIGLIPVYAKNGLELRSNGNFTFYVNDIGKCKDKKITIPSKYLGMPVTSIGDWAFSDCSSLTSISIPDSVTSIGSAAFYGCSGLTSIDIPDSVTSIGSSAFYRCSSLTNISIPGSVTSIGSSAFYDCSSLTSISIPDSVTSIGHTAFWNCSSLTSISIPDSVTSIGDYAFWDCSSLTSISVPDGVTRIGDLVFDGCSSLTNISIPDSVTSIGNSAFSGCTGLTSITIPDSVTSIGERAFYGCSSLTSISIPDSVTSIGWWAFRNCSSLTSISIPTGVTRIGDYAFEDCSSLTSITYGGTKAQWKAITFWNYNTGNYTVTCTDGTVSK